MGGCEKWGSSLHCTCNTNAGSLVMFNFIFIFNMNTTHEYTLHITMHITASNSVPDAGLKITRLCAKESDDDRTILVLVLFGVWCLCFKFKLNCGRPWSFSSRWPPLVLVCASGVRDGAWRCLLPVACCLSPVASASGVLLASLFSCLCVQVVL